MTTPSAISLKTDFVYRQSTGEFYRVTKPALALMAVGYAGKGQHLNRPQSECVRSQGPLPRGRYRLHYVGQHHRLGPTCIFLSPEDWETQCGRSGFFIHGDNSRGNKSASSGCIILGPATRMQIAAAVRAADGELVLTVEA